MPCRRPCRLGLQQDADGAVSRLPFAFRDVSALQLEPASGDLSLGAALAGSGMMPDLGTGDVQFSPALAGSGNLQLMGAGNVTFTVGLSGVSALSDTSLPYKHYEEFSNVEGFLNLT